MRNVDCYCVCVYVCGYVCACVWATTQLETPVIMRMLGMKEWTPEQSTKDNILLFCRHKPGPYVFCGRVTYVSHNPEKLPLEFVWELVDFDAMVDVQPQGAGQSENLDGHKGAGDEGNGASGEAQDEEKEEVFNDILKAAASY